MTKPTDARGRERLALIAATALPAATCLLFVAARLDPEAALGVWALESAAMS